MKLSKLKTAQHLVNARRHEQSVLETAMNDFTTKTCRLCNGDFPVTTEHFYKHSQAKDGFHSHCKECAKRKSSIHHAAKTSNIPSGRPNENTFIDHLSNLGIVAHMGALYREFKFMDVVAWGCVTIELKYSKPQDGKYKFEFTPRQRRLNGEGVHIICLAVDSGKKTDYHFFDAKNPLFYQDGKLKNSVYYHPNPQRRNKPPVLTDDMMAMSKNNIALIEQKRLSHSQQLIAIAQAA